MTAKRIIKDYALLWAMILGAIFYPWLWQLAPICTYTLFVMLLLSYTKIEPKDIQVKPAHILMFVMQWVLGILSYIIIQPFDPIIATGVALVILTPTATAASVITHILGGNIAFVTTYLLISNAAIALIGPILISAIVPDAQGTYWGTAFTILQQVSALLILPLAIVWLLRYCLPKVHDGIAKFSFWTFWIWAFNVMILMAKAIRTYTTSESLTPEYTILLLLITLACTLTMYYLGGRSARWTGEATVNGRQTLGQKNTVFAIWLALVFLDSEVAFIPTLYIIVQNVINSLEIAAYKRNEKADGTD